MTSATCEPGSSLVIDLNTREAYRRLLGDGDIPGRLVVFGVEAVELPLGPGTDLANAAKKARLRSGAGLLVSPHPYTEGQPANPA